MNKPLKKAYPPTPLSFQQRMEDTLANLNRPAMAHKRLTAVAVALACMLAVCGIGYAASRSALLLQLFRGNQPSPQAASLLTQANAQTEQNGITFSIDEYLLDGSDLYLQWSVKSERDEPLLLLSTDPALSPACEVTVMENDTSAAAMSFAQLDQAHPEYSAVTRLHFEADAPNDPFSLTMSLLLYAPQAPVEDVDALDAFTDTLKLVRFEGEDWTQVQPFTEMEIDGDGRSFTGSFDGECEDIDALVRSGIVREAGRLTLSLPITPDPENIVHTEIIGKRAFTFDKFTLLFDEADFTAAGAMIRFRMLSHENVELFDSLGANLWFDVLPDGVSGENAFLLSCSSDDGRTLHCEISAYANSSIPKTVRIIPCDNESGLPLPQYTVDLKLRQVPGTTAS